MSRERELLERALDGLNWYEYKDLMEEIRAYLAEPKVPLVRLTEEEVTEVLTSAYDMYAAICATENMLVRKNTINKSDPDSIDLQSKCRGDKL